MEEEQLLKTDTSKTILPEEFTDAELIIAVKGPTEAGEPQGDEPDAAYDQTFAALACHVTAPQPSAAALITGEDYAGPLPPAQVGIRPVLPAIELHRPLTLRGLSGLPPLARVSGGLTSPRRRLAVGPPETADSPNLDQLPRITIQYLQYDPARPNVWDDITAEESRRVLLSDVDPFRVKASPFLRLVIPEPFEAIRAVQLRSPPPDTEGPDGTGEMPPRPKLPTQKP